MEPLCAVIILGTRDNKWLLEAQLGLWERYKNGLSWPVYYTTEFGADTWIQKICGKHAVSILPLESWFKDLPASIQYILPLQDDVFLDRPGINSKVLQGALELLETHQTIGSMRCMPCPASSCKKEWIDGWTLFEERDVLFSYQATLWRRDMYVGFLEKLYRFYLDQYPVLESGSKELAEQITKDNACESHIGTLILKSHWPNMIHLCWMRKGLWANAVFWSPIPYRPGAIKGGELESWAADYIRREGFYLYESRRSS